MFIPYRPPEVPACISAQKCVVRFETECSLPNTSTMVRHIVIECVAFQETNRMH